MNAYHVWHLKHAAVTAPNGLNLKVSCRFVLRVSYSVGSMGAGCSQDGHSQKILKRFILGLTRNEILRLTHTHTYIQTQPHTQTHTHTHTLDKK